MQPESRHIASASSISLLDLFRIGIGPSSSHTFGPMRAANAFLDALAGREGRIARLAATAYGSLAWTGKGHATDKAMILGLAGCRPDEIFPDEADQLFRGIAKAHVLRLPDGREIGFDPARDVSFDRQTQFERHTNAMRYAAFDATGQETSLGGLAAIVTIG
ncbi:MAG: serine dehydratase beta chain [Acidocella sp.]|nr:serine dehydratase beta chain [Acidocella sp.]